jgi:hypothetical protein
MMTSSRRPVVEPVSVLGERDFHVLEARAARVRVLIPLRLANGGLSRERRRRATLERARGA